MLHPAHAITPAVLTCLLLAGAEDATAQAAKKVQAQDSRSEQVIEKVISTDDGSGAKTRRFRKVMKDGKVIEISGDPELEVIGLDGMDDVHGVLKKLKRIDGGDGHGDVHVKVLKNADQESHTRRVVVVNGKTVVDEETVNGKPVKPGAKKKIRVIGPDGDLEELHELRGLERLHELRGLKELEGLKELKGLDDLHDIHEQLQEMLEGHGADLEMLHEHLQELRHLGESDAHSEHNSSSHRVVIVNGEKVVDEKTENGKPVHVIKGDDLSKHLRVEIERLLDEDLDDLPVRLHEELERSLKGIKELPKEDLHERVRVRLHEDLKDLPSRLHEELERTLKRDLGRIHEINVDMNVDDLHQRLQGELRKIHEEFEGPEMQRVHEKIKKALERHGLDDFLEEGHGPIQVRIQKKEDADKDAKPRPRGIKV